MRGSNAPPDIVSDSTLRVSQGSRLERIIPKQAAAHASASCLSRALPAPSLKLGRGDGRCMHNPTVICRGGPPVVEVCAHDLGAAAPRYPALVDGADLMPDATNLGNLSQEVHCCQQAALKASCNVVDFCHEIADALIVSKSQWQYESAAETDTRNTKFQVCTNALASIKMRSTVRTC